MALESTTLLPAAEQVTRTLNGNRTLLTYKVRTIPDEVGKPRYLLSIGQDITELKQAEKIIAMNVTGPPPAGSSWKLSTKNWKASPTRSRMAPVRRRYAQSTAMHR